YTRSGQSATPFLCAASYSARRPFHEATPMDFVYLLFLLVLCAAVLGFALVSDRLDPRRYAGCSVRLPRLQESRCVRVLGAPAGMLAAAAVGYACVTRLKPEWL